MIKEVLIKNFPMADEPGLDFKDVELICKDCGKRFIFTAKEQKFYAKQGFVNAPARCLECREEFQKKKYRGAPVYNVKCKKCGLVGKITSPVPYPNFVYCETCFNLELEAEKKLKGQLPKTIIEAKENLSRS